jgi:hypothetical protein
LSYFWFTILKSSGKWEWYGVCALLSARKMKGEDYEGPDETLRNFTGTTKSCPVHSGAAEKEFRRLRFARCELSGLAICPTLALIKKPTHHGTGMSDIIRWILGKLLGPFVPEPVPVPVEPAPRPNPRKH